jgi:2-methylisocitrate lyase-like PEP mutase family enzyme
VVAAGFPVVATTSGGVAAALGYEDHEGAPGDEMGVARVSWGTLMYHAAMSRLKDHLGALQD